MHGAVLWIQRLFLALGFILLGYVGSQLINSHIRQAEGSRELSHVLTYNRPHSDTAPIPVRPVPHGGLIGKIEIPDLHLSAIIFQGTDDPVLSHGIGHLDESALPGQPGNVVLAAHRDTFFRPLRFLKQGDLITLTTPDGPRTYKVDWTKIVAPTEVSVEDPTPKPALTLITCYPFYYVGHAPKRFIVRAQDISDRAISGKAISGQALLTQGASTKAISANPEAETARPAVPRERAQGSELTYIFRASQ